MSVFVVLISSDWFPLIIDGCCYRSVSVFPACALFTHQNFHFFSSSLSPVCAIVVVLVVREWGVEVVKIYVILKRSEGWWRHIECQIDKNRKKMKYFFPAVKITHSHRISSNSKSKWTNERLVGIMGRAQGKSKQASTNAVCARIKFIFSVIVLTAWMMDNVDEMRWFCLFASFCLFNFADESVLCKSVA